jgi:hypothetical protein
MAILVLSSSTFTKGSPLLITLNKADLLAHPTVAADPYFSNSFHWNKVFVIMESTDSEQQIPVQFDASSALPTAQFEPSIKSKDDFEVQFIQIRDYDGGSLLLTRDEIPSVEDFDLTVGAVADFIPDAVDWLNFSDFSADNAITGIDTTITLELSAVYGIGTPIIEYRKNVGPWIAFTPSIPSNILIDNGDTIGFRVQSLNVSDSATITINNVSDGNTTLDAVTGTVITPIPDVTPDSVDWLPLKQWCLGRVYYCIAWICFCL